MAVPRRERVIVSSNDIPSGYMPMCKVPSSAYDRIKKAVQRREIDSLCLYPDGDRRLRPRKYVSVEQVREWLESHPLYSERKNVFETSQARVPQTLPGTGATSLDAEVRNSVFLKMSELANAITILTSSIQVVTDQLEKAIAAQGEREPFILLRDE